MISHTLMYECVRVCMSVYKTREEEILKQLINETKVVMLPTSMKTMYMMNTAVMTPKKIQSFQIHRKIKSRLMEGFHQENNSESIERFIQSLLIKKFRFISDS